MEDLANRLAALTDQQVLQILDGVTGEIASPDAPEGTAAQAQALQSVVGEGGLDVHQAADASPAASAAAARELLVVMSQFAELRPMVEDWTANPPHQEAAAIPLILAAPVVFTACVAFLQFVGHSRFERKADGRWTFAYDANRQTSFDQTMPQVVGALGKMMVGAIPQK